MTDTNHDTLRKLAEAATQGLWAAALLDEIAALKADNDRLRVKQANDWCPLSELPQDRDGTYMVCVENVGGTGIGKGWIDRAWICPAENSGWLNAAGEPIEIGPWKVTKFRAWPELPETEAALGGSHD